MQRLVHHVVLILYNSLRPTIKVTCTSFLGLCKNSMYELLRMPTQIGERICSSGFALFVDFSQLASLEIQGWMFRV